MTNKYHAKRTWSELCQRYFASKWEAERGEQLTLLEKAGEIEDLCFQVPFMLSQFPKVKITIDFVYTEKGIRTWEDAKGVLTRDTRTKLAWLKQLYGIEVKLSRE